MSKTAEYWFEMTSTRRKTVAPTPARVAQFEADAILVRMFDVGAGEAIVASGPSGEAVLIDGGSTTGNARNKSLAGAIAGYLDGRALAAFVATHPHKDHLGAIQYLVQSPDVALANDAIFYNNGKPPRKATAGWWMDLNAALDARGVDKVPVEGLIRVPAFAGLGDAALYTAPYGAPEYQSVFLHLVRRNARLLFTGDAYCRYENKLLQAYTQEGVFAAHVLKATHHGSQDGTGKALAKAVGPRLAFASTEYDPDLPSDAQDHAWERASRRRLPRSCRTFETYLNGDVELQTDGRGLEDGPGALFRVRTQLPGIIAGALGLSSERPRSYVADEATTDPGCSESP